VTGTLGASAHFSLAAIYPLEGLLADATHSYALVLGLVGIAPLFAFAILCWRWPAQQPQPSSST
jgi:ACS family hexuronate transporter-like MFS transporter